MKKHSLLGAAALSTVAFAGVANAQTLEPSANAGATLTARSIVATESQLTAAQRQGTAGLTYLPAVGVPAALSKLTLSLTGGATFGAAAPTSSIANGNCKATVTLSSGGAKTDSTVTYLVENLDTCTTDGVKINLPILLAAGSTTSVNVTAALTTELGTPIAAGSATTNKTAVTPSSLVSFGKSIVVTTTADTVPTYATLASDFKALATGVSTPPGDNKIGTVEIANKGYLLGINAPTTLVTGTEYADTTFTVRGDLTNLNVTVGGQPVVQGAAVGEGTVKFTPAANATYDVLVSTKGTTPVIPGSAYDITTRLAPNTGALVNAVVSGPSSLQSVTREGASYLIPWVASGTLAQASTSNTVIRISNLSNAPIGRVSAELLTNSTGVANSTTLVQLAPSIAGRGEVIVTSASLEAAFGANFGRGDIRLTVEGQQSNLVVRRFVQSTTNGALSEVSLGRSAIGTEPQN